MLPAELIAFKQMFSSQTRYYLVPSSHVHHILNTCSVEAIDYEAPLLLRALTVLFFSLCGTSVAWGFSAALGDATWSVSTGLGSLFAAGIYEVGRPDRLSVQEAQELEDQWQVFGKLPISCSPKIAESALTSILQRYDSVSSASTLMQSSWQ